MLLLVPLALADHGIAPAEDMAPCMEAYVTGTVPAAGAEDVPLDIAPAFVWMDDCSIGGEFSARLEQDGELLVEESFSVDGASGLERLFPEELQANTSYRFLITDSWSEVEILFTTGEGFVVGAEPPVVISTSASFWDAGNHDFQLQTRVEADFGQDPDHSSVLLLVDAEGGILAATATAPSTLSHRELVQSAPAEGCVLLVQEDGAGLRSEPIKACAEAEFIDDGQRRLGCSTGGLGASLALGLAGLIALRRRR